MAVSYLSTNIIHANPYVVPFDLSLMMKVNQYKQSQFYQNADKLNSQFEQLNSLDILNPYQNQHAKDVVNNLGAQVQNMGGLDLSNPNVANTLSGYTADVYNDKTILNGIMSTKAIRTYNANSDAMKNDPKLAKYYDSTREWYDKYAPAEINPNSQANYVKGDINSTYNGPTAPAPYLGSDWDILTKEIQKINPNIQESYGPSGNRFFIDMTTKKEVDPYTIRKMLDGRIDGAVADQLNVHAAYNYYALTNGTYSKEQGLAEYNKYNQGIVDGVNSQISALQTQIAQEPDNLKRAALQDQLNTYQNTYLPQATKALVKSNDDFSNLWDKSKSAALYTLYTNKLKDDISQAYSYTQTSHKLIVNQEAIMNARIDMEAAAKGLKAIRNANGDITYAKAGEGQFPGAGDPTPIQGQLQRDFSSEADLEKNKVTQQAINDRITTTQNGLNSNLRDLTYKTARMAGINTLFDDIQQSINNDPNSNAVSHTDKLKQIAQLTGDNKQLEVSDIDRVLQNIDKAGTFDDSGNFKFNGNNDKQVFYNPATKKPIVSLTANEITFFKKLQTVLDRGADGENIDGLLTNAGEWKQFATKYSIEQNSINSDKKLIDSTTQQVYDNLTQNANLTPIEANELKKFIANPSLYTNTGGNPVTFGGTAGGAITNGNDNTYHEGLPRSKAMVSALEKLQKNGITWMDIPKQVDELLNNTANRENYYSKLLPDDPKDLEDKYPNIINYMLNSGMEVDKSVAKSVKEIRPVAIVTDGKQNFIKYVNTADQTKIGYTPITEENLKAFGVEPLPYPDLERTVIQDGHLNTPIYVDPLATGNTFNKENGITGPFKIDIYNMNPTAGRNSNNFMPAIVYKGKPYYYKPGASTSANAALQAITSVLQSNTTFRSIDQSTYTTQDGKTYTADQLKSQFNLTDEDLLNAVKNKTVIETPSLLQAMQNYNNK